MRTLDIACAVFISIMSIAVMAIADPSQIRGESAHISRQIQLQKGIVATVQKAGILLFYTGKLSEICSLLRGYSNGTVSLSAILDGRECERPMAGATVSNLTIYFEARRVVLQAWSTGTAG